MLKPAMLLLLFAAVQLSAQTGAGVDSLKTPAVSIADTTKPALAATPVLKPDSIKTPKRAEKLAAAFDTLQTELAEGEVFSKVLRVTSNIDAPLSFRIDVNYPAQWRSLVNTKKFYTIDPHDTIFIPVRLVPLGKVMGSTKYMINAYLFDTIGAPITSGYVSASKPKFAKWSLNVGPNKKIYFKNDSSEARFSINVGNEGTEAQDIYMSMINIRRDIIIIDTTGRIIKNPKYSFRIPQFGDTTMFFGAKIFSTARNMKRLDSEGYRPGKPNETKSYNIFIKTTETNLSGANARQMSKKLEFVQLPNNRKVNDYGMYALPLIMDFNMTNLFSNRPVAYLRLNGAATLDNGSVISYNTQLAGAFGIYGGSYFAPLFFTLGYYDHKLTVMAGDVGGSAGSIGIGGKGVNASYRIDRRNRVGAFFVVNPGFFNRLTYYGTGVNYNFSLQKLQFSAGYGHIERLNSNMTSDYVSANAGYVIGANHSVSLGGGLSRNSFLGNTKYGFSVNAGYHASFIKSRLQTNVTGGYFSNTYNYYSNGERYMFNHNSSFRLNYRWSFRLNNSYNQHDALVTPLVTNFSTYKIFNNSLGAARTIDIHSSIGSAFFYDVVKDDFYRYSAHSRGISFSYNYTLPQDYFMFGFTSRFGYNRVVSVIGAPEKFSMSLFSLVKYRVFSITARFSNGLANGYLVGPTSSQLFSQNFAASLNYQYQFRNRHMILNNAINYNLMPEIDRHSLGYTPELNYYTSNGWRFRVTGGVYYTSSRPYNYNPYKVFVNPSNQENANARVTNTSYMLMFGIRKEFGIPLPFIKRRFPTLDFIAFVDINGNGKCDNDEARLENVVVGVNGWEILTNDRGEAQLKNIPEGEYPWYVFSLEDVKGFFPKIDDKIKAFATDSNRQKQRPVLIPFVKGIKLYGRVYLDREKLSPDALKGLDLSGIRISVNCNDKKSSTLTDGEGSFMFYLPYGNYTVSMDEKILGDHFRLLQNDIEVQLNKGIDNMFVSFYVAENQRKINRKRFGPDGKPIEDGANPNAAAAAKAAEDAANANKDLVAEANAAARKAPRPKYDVAKDAFLADKIDATTTKGLIYTIQLGAFQKPLNPKVFSGFKNIMYERIDNEFVRITVGNIVTEAEAKAERDNLAKVGFPSAYVSVYYFGKNINLTEANLLLKSGGGK